MDSFLEGFARGGELHRPPRPGAQSRQDESVTVFHEELQQFAAEHHVALLENDTTGFAVRDSASIVSSVPFLQLVRGEEQDFDGLDREICLGSGSDRVTTRASLRPLPSEADTPSTLVTWAQTRHGDLVPVGAIDRRAGTAHVLLDPRSLSSDVFSGLRGARRLVEQLFGVPLRALLEQAPPPRVGPRVGARVRTFLSAPATRGRVEYLEEELEFLKQFAEDGPLEPELEERRRLLEEVLRHPQGTLTGRHPDASEVDRNISHLERLVESRSFAVLHLGSRSLRGVTNPRAHPEGIGRILPVAFSLEPGRLSGETVLCLGDPSKPLLDLTTAQCIDGWAEVVFDAFDDARDLYSLCDAILNFIETNEVGLVTGHASMLDGTVHVC